MTGLLIFFLILCFKYSVPIYSLNSCKKVYKNIQENSLHSSIEETLIFSKISLGHVHPESHRKILDLDWSFLPHPRYSSDLVSSDIHLFHSLQNSINDHFFFVLDQVKIS